MERRWFLMVVWKGRKLPLPLWEPNGERIRLFISEVEAHYFAHNDPRIKYWEAYEWVTGVPVRRPR
jgi:hypothetical protein